MLGVHVSVSTSDIMVSVAQPPTMIQAWTPSVYITAVNPPAIVIRAVRQSSRVTAAYVFHPSAISIKIEPE